MASKHPRTHFFLSAGLFDDLTSFHDLETRIAALPTTRHRGDAFEVFAEAYLATQNTIQAREVWPLEVVADATLKKLALPATDMGVDGVFEDRVGNLCAYQVKFRTQRPSLTWGELSTFIGLTDVPTWRYLFTNCDDLPTILTNRLRFVPIRGSDLDRLLEADLAAIRAWMASGVFTPPRKAPRPHQTRAVDDIVASLTTHPRVTCLMACGTGKTLVALWVAERIGFRTMLVLLPSLALVRQTLHEWLRETSLGDFSYLCVCSDPTVTKGADDLVLHQSDLDFPVTTNGADVRRFLRSDSHGVQIVFSTYQSAKVVAQGMEGDFAFDFGVFDEAHKTAGREGTRSSFGLWDDALPIRKRLFMTATPRHYDIRGKRTADGDAPLVYSMDKPETYGPVAHSLSVSKAVTEGIICDYQVLISVVTDAEVDRYLIAHGEVSIEDSPVAARQVALQLALTKAVEKHGAQRIFTFHGNIASAKSFASDGPGGVGTHLREFATYHVNGAMPTADRTRLMRDFVTARRALMSNARCLTEGVDLPAVDMVAFMSPRRSKVDIIQAVGRVMRRHETKTIGYVLVPIFLEALEGETVQDAVRRSDFEDVWDVLEALKESDQVLADIIRDLTVGLGRRESLDGSLLAAKVQVLGPVLSMEALRSAITTEIVARLGLTWDQRIGELAHFREIAGHCNVPKGWQDNPALSNWIYTQRQSYQKGLLSAERTRRLDELGFVWEVHGATWEENFQALVDFKKAQGHCIVPQNSETEPVLASWVSVQRGTSRKGLMPPDRKRRLDELGFVWDVYDATWEENFQALVDFKKAQGHCIVPRYWKRSPGLGEWVSKQRVAYRRGELTKDHVRRLQELHFTWDVDDARWEENFHDLVAFKNVHGHCVVPRYFEGKGVLAQWVAKQRVARKRGDLSLKNAYGV